jgi:mono/diheme cytochrome c family protein
VFRRHAADCGRGSDRFERTRNAPVRWRWIAAMSAMILMLLAAAGCDRALPEPNTAAAQLYARRCGQCHRAYAPGSLSAAMWQVQVEMMEAKMHQYRVPPLSNQERDTILSYLTRNAEHN